MKKKKISEKKMPLLGHLKELRVRLLRSFVVTILVFLVCYFFRDDLLKILKDPVVQPLAKYSQLQKKSFPLNKENLSKENLSKNKLGEIVKFCRRAKKYLRNYKIGL